MKVVIRYTITEFSNGFILSLTFSQILVVMLGGSLGALMRFVVSNTVTAKLGSNFPYGTLTVNIIGSFLMGFLQNPRL